MRPDDIKPKDLRKYSILPFNAVMDKRINRTRALHVLAALCSYVDRNGVTFVSQDRLAADLGISRQAVNKQLTALCSTWVTGCTPGSGTRIRKQAPSRSYMTPM